jgi:hypothetical protein
MLVLAGGHGRQARVEPRKADVRVTQFGLAWVPCWRTTRAGADGIAAMVAYLAGLEAGFVTGASLTIDGGFTAETSGPA